jgi:CheY-like chemotaxis protein
METRNATPPKRHVVIVDDNAELAWFFSEILKLHGYETLVFSDAVAALKHVLAQHPDVILCDLQMPQLDGDLFYATVERANPALTRRFIFVTGEADDSALPPLRPHGPRAHPPQARCGGNTAGRGSPAARLNDGSLRLLRARLPVIVSFR